MKPKFEFLNSSTCLQNSHLFTYSSIDQETNPLPNFVSTQLTQLRINFTHTIVNYDPLQRLTTLSMMFRWRFVWRPMLVPLSITETDRGWGRRLAPPHSQEPPSCKSSPGCSCMNHVLLHSPLNPTNFFNFE